MALAAENGLNSAREIMTVQEGVPIPWNMDINYSLLNSGGWDEGGSWGEGS